MYGRTASTSQPRQVVAIHRDTFYLQNAQPAINIAHGLNVGDDLKNAVRSRFSEVFFEPSKARGQFSQPVILTMANHYDEIRVVMRNGATELELTEANRSALAQVYAHAARERPRHMARIESLLAAAGIDAGAEDLLDAVSNGAALTLNFHPDRLLADGRRVAQALYDEGVYRSQFETRISNGGLSAYPGGDRDVWEQALFGGAYQAPGVRAAERPKYGGLNLMNHLNGASPRFGSCHLRLRPEATGRATLVFGDSAAQPKDLGLVDTFSPVLAPLLEAIASGTGALGRAGVDVRSFVDGLLSGDHARRRGVFASEMTHTLNDYIEAHIHGELRLAADVEAIVIDPVFGGSPAGELLLRAGERYGFPVEQHSGLAIALSQIPQQAPDLPATELMRWQTLCADGRARRLAEHVVEEQDAQPRLDAANIGQAAVSVVRDPARWRDWGAPHQVLVHLKDLWLMLVAHGQPLS